VPGFMKGFMAIKSSTRATWALRGGLTWAMKQLRVGLRYERVEPDFMSMGAGYITGDREDITLAPSGSPFNGLRLNASLGIRRNNLIHDKLATTTRLISSFGGTWEATRDLGFDLRYSNYATSSSDGRVRVTDTTRIENVSQMVSGGPRFAFGSGNARHSLSLNLTHQRYDDRNIISGALSANRSTIGSLSYGSTIDEYGLNGALSVADMESNAYANTSINLTGGGSKAYLDNRLSLNASLTISIVHSSEGTESQLLPSCSANYLLTDRDVFTFTLQLSQNTRTNSPYTEIISSAGYSRTF
jgi:hypothetical protein